MHGLFPPAVPSQSFAAALFSLYQPVKGRALDYLNDYRTKRIIVDRQRAPLVKHAFEQYATGTVVLDDLRKYFSANGVKTKKGKMVGRTFVSDLLSNPIHYGHFRYAGEVYEGKHEPIISKKLFDEADAVFNRRWRYSPSERHTN